MKKSLTVILVLIPIVATAQEGVITYDRAIKYEYKIPDVLKEMKDQIPTQSTESMMLLFNQSESVMLAAPAKEEEQGEQDAVSVRAKRMVMRLKMGSASRSDQEIILETYCNRDDATFTETRKFMTRMFLLRGEQPTFAWKLSGEEGEYLGYPVQKATAMQDSTSIEAWFSPEIPVSGGPGLFSGLPGMILVVNVDDGRVVYSATEVSLDGLAGREILPPTDGQEVSTDEYEAIVQEKLKEIKALRNRRGRDRR